MVVLQSKIFKPIIQWEYTSTEGKKFYEIVTSIEEQLNSFLLELSEDAIHSIRYYPSKDPKNTQCLVLFRAHLIEESDFEGDSYDTNYLPPF